MELLPDEELERLAAERGPDSLEAQTLADLRQQRAQDKQVFAFRLGKFLVVGPMPTPEEETAFLLANEVANCGIANTTLAVSGSGICCNKTGARALRGSASARHSSHQR